MKLAFEGILVKPRGKEKYWSVGVPLLEIYSQGKTPSHALVMIKNAVEEAIAIKGFKIAAEMIGSYNFAITASDFNILLAFMLKQQRITKQLSLRDVSKRLGSNSPNAYARYEQAKASTSLEKLADLMDAVNNEKFLVLKTG